MAGIRDARRADDVDPRVALLAQRRRPRVEPDANSDPETAWPLGVAKRALHRKSRTRSGSRVGERGHVLVSDCVGLRTVVRRDLLAKQAAEERDRVRILGRRLALERGRALDVREEERDRASGERVHGFECIPGVSSTSGISASTAVPPPTGLSTVSFPSRTATRSTRPRRPEPAARVGSADTVVRHGDAEHAVRLGDLDPGGRCLRVLGDVRERLGDDVVRGGLGLGRIALVGRREFNRDRCPRCERLERRPQAAIREDGRVDSSGELAELRERLRQLLARAVEELRGAAGVRLDLRLDEAQRDRQGDKSLLRAVMKVPLERAPRLLLGSHEPCARGSQVLRDPLSLGDVEAGDEKKLALVDLRERRACPRNREALARARHPGVVVLARRRARGNRLNEAPDIVGLGRVDELLPEHLAADLRRLVSERALEGDVRPTLRKPSVMFDETQEARSVVRDRVQEGSLALLVDLEPAPLGDFDARDEYERLAAPCDIGDGDRRPGERTQCPVSTAELRLDLLGCSTGRCGTRLRPRPGRRRPGRSGPRTAARRARRRASRAPVGTLDSQPTRGLSRSRSRIVPSRSRTTAMLGVASSAVVVASRSRSSSSSRFRRSVMSRPPETMLTTRPAASLTGAARQ